MTAFHPHLVTQRLGVARLVLWVTLGVLVIAFFRAQILEHGRYQLQSESNRLRPIPLPAPRGIITDRNGKIIAENVPGYTIALLPGDESAMRVPRSMLTRIIQARQQRPFQSVDDLRHVKGIGPKTLENLRPFVKVD